MPYGTLIDCATLAAHLDDADWLVVDCRHQLSDPQAGEAAYLKGHLPGAVFFHLDRDLSSPMNGRNGRHPWPDPLLLAKSSVLRALPIPPRWWSMTMRVE